MTPTNPGDGGGGFDPPPPGLWHSPQACSRCGTVNTIPAHSEIGAGLICHGCAHYLLITPGWVLCDLTPAEADFIRNHKAFPKIRAMQEEMCRRNGFFG